MGVFEAAQERPLGGPKQRLVLAHLLIRANQAVPVDTLISEIWDEPPATARGSVQSYVSHLRKALGAGRIDGNGQGYVLHVEPHEVDRSRFEALVVGAGRLRPTDPAAAAAMLREALDLWRGPPFADLADVPSLQPEITRLTEARIAAVEDRIAAELDAGAPRDVVGELEALTAEHPLRERLWELLIIALYRSGRQADALQAYERARLRLADELGIDPSEELQTLHQRVLRQDPALRGSTVRVKGYQLVERLGEDAFGTTWRATPPGVDRVVAIKVARPELANDPAFIRRFDADAQRIAGIEHPHVVPVYDFWREPDGAYIVTRHLRGGSLRQLLDRSGTPDRTAALRIASQVTGALAAAHRRGVVHGGLTVGDVLLDEEGNAYLADLGIALMSGDAGQSAAEGPRRAATEDHRDLLLVDLRALGSVLSPMLTGNEGPVRGVLGRIADPAASGDDAAALLSGLRAAIDDATGTAPAPGTGPAASLRHNPYKGLRAFTEGDADDFFGRDAVVAQLLSRLRADGYGARFLAVVGPSGSGKSSVVRAGLVPALRAGAVPKSDGWFIAQLVPGDRPFDELATALRHIAVDAPDDLATRLARPEGLPDVLPQLLPDDADLLIVVDQFEELFTLVVDDDRRGRFIDMLVGAVNAPSSRVRLVVTLRADFYDRPLDQGELGALTRARTEAIAPMTAAELERAITAPAERAGVTVERRLVAQMVADVADQPGALPLLQYALTELFDRRDDAALTVAGYRDIGGIAGALARRAETTYVGLYEAGQRACRDLCLRLVTPGEGVEDTRRRAQVAEVTALAPNTMPDVLDAFGAARLLSFDRDPETRAPTVEVAHEALLREWRRLRGWIDAARDDLRTHRRLRAAAADWTAADRDPSYLATGAQLAQYEAWRGTAGLTATAEEDAYLDASVEHRDLAAAEEAARQQRERDLERRSVRRLRTLVAVLGAAALIAGALTVVAVTQGRRAADEALRAEGEALRAEREARVATARELAAAADANLTVDPERSMLLAIEAINATGEADEPVLPEAEEALHAAVNTSRIERRFADVGGDIDWSADGALLAHEGDDGTGLVEILNAATGQVVASWHGHDSDVNALAFSPDGRLLATAGEDGAARVWDPRTGDEVGAIEDRDGSEVWGPAFSADSTLFAAAAPDAGWARIIDVRSGRRIFDRTFNDRAPLSLALSTDGHRVAIGFDDGFAMIVHVRTGRRLATLTGHDDAVLNAAWSPDGRWLATSSADATARIWDGHTGEPRLTLRSHTGPVQAIDWHGGASTRLVTGSDDGNAKIWDISEGGAREQLTLAGEPFDGMPGVAFSPDGQQVATGDIDFAAIAIWDVREIGTGEWATVPTTNAQADLTRDGRQLVTLGGEQQIDVWDATDGTSIRSIADDRTSAAVGWVAANPAHPLVAATVDDTSDGGGGGTATVWATDTGAQAFVVPHEHDMSDVSWSRDGELLASSDFGGFINVTDRSGSVLATLRDAQGRPFEDLRFSPDGRHIAVSTWTPRARHVSIWDWERGDVVHEIEDHRHPEDFAFIGDGRQLVVATGEGHAAVWDTTTWEQLATFTGHAGPIVTIDAVPDGDLVATGGTGGTVRLWDPTTGTERLALEGHRGVVGSIAFGPDGKTLASADSTGVARVWALDLDDLIAIADARLTRGLIDAECREYLHADTCPPR
jgi:WD40 repeat protein/DNA-binding SARP family transcriptional activator